MPTVPIINLALKSIFNRRLTALLTLFSIALSVALLLGVERLRTETRTSFANTISGTDLVVGARSGAVQLLLYSVFHIGDPTNNISWASYQEIADHPRVAWTVPLMLGDSHKGYRVVGTTTEFFSRYRYARDRPLAMGAGRIFDDLYEAVLGAEVAAKLGYTQGREIVISHGAGSHALLQHDDKPFRVVGILAATGTPVDRTVLVSLAGIEAIHAGWQAGVTLPAGLRLSAEQARSLELIPSSISAFLVGLNSRSSIFHVQRFINEYRREPLLAILPGVVLQELWELIGVAENALLAVSGLVVLTGLTGMLTVLLTSLNERRREMAILRSLGARPVQVLGLIVGEALFLVMMGVAAGVALLYMGLWVAQPLLEARLNLVITISPLSMRELTLIGAVIAAGGLAGLFPGYRAYGYSLADGLTLRL
jgi:putative ABC transport system permease protein